MDISILCSSKEHPVYKELVKWLEKTSRCHNVTLFHDVDSLSSGDLLFLVSCNEKVEGDVRARFKATLVLHASDLPAGKGWSPHIWQILEGKNSIVVSLINAEDSIDSGDIWAQATIEFEGHELHDEINEKLFKAELELMDFAVNQFGRVKPSPQASGPSTFYPKRSPKDSELDPNQSLAEVFDLLRVCDPERFPAFFYLRGQKYNIRVEKD